MSLLIFRKIPVFSAVRYAHREGCFADPGPAGPPSLKMIHWIIFRALRAHP